MGFMKSSKVGAITADAQRAIQEGRTHFVARYWDEALNFQGTGSVSGCADAIENVEAAGWDLTQMAYSWVDKKNRGVTILVFSRQAPTQSPPVSSPAPVAYPPGQGPTGF